jgi:hypothetical protein
VGFKTAVSGNKMAIADAGPKPGNTPTIVPTKAPIAAISILTGSRADENPEINMCNDSIPMTHP